MRGGGVSAGVAFVVAAVFGAVPGRALGATHSSLRVTLPQSIVRIEPSAPSMRPHITRAELTSAESAAPLDFEVAFRMRNFAEMEARVAGGERISAGEKADRYLPSEADYEAALDWLAGEGFTLLQTDPDRIAIFARGTVAQIRQAFQVEFSRVAFGGAEYTSAVTEPSLPSDLAPAILGINGLQPHLRAHRHAELRPLSTLSYAPPYLPSQILQAYNGSGLGVNGATQVIGIVDMGFPNSSDLETFWSEAGVAQSIGSVSEVQVVSGTLPPADDETTLDVEWASGIATGAKINLYATIDLNFVHIDAAYARILKDAQSNPGLRQVSLSYGAPEATGASASDIQTSAQYFLELANAGVSVLVSSGDGGSNPDDNGQYDPSATLQAETPASDPNVTAVGGTSLVLNNVGGAVVSETAWSGSGGGVSIYSSRPSWQTGTGVPAGTMRVVPDVAMTGDPGEGGLVVYDGVGYQFGGTSWAAPIWAGICAMINQAREAAGQPALGLLGPKLYPLLGSANFRDITSGSNGAYNAGTGYDLCTGIGVPNVTNLLHTLASYTAPPQVPVITAQPSDETVAAGSPAQFLVAATGSSALSYQWRKNGSAISGASAASYSIASVQASDAGSYSVTVSDSAGSVTSNSAILSVITAPTITVPPASLSVTVGASASFSVTATGTAPLAYQWYKNGAAIVGASGTSYAIPSVQNSDGGLYQVIVTNAAGSATSGYATLTVNSAPPVIVTPPASESVSLGAAVSLSVTATGQAPLSYQWYRNGAAISGATASSYALASAQSSDAGVYTVKVSNAVGSVTSGGATLAVVVPPVASTTPQNLVAIAGSSTTLAGSASGTAPFSYQWFFNGGLLAGINGPYLVFPAVEPANAGTYSYTVSNSAGSATSAPLNLMVVVPPAITGQPSGHTVLAGASVTLSVSASGSGPFSYQWELNGTALPGANQASLTLNGVEPANAGSYSVVVSNSAGSATSNAAALVVQLPSRLINMSVRAMAAAGQPLSVGFALGGAGTGGSTPVLIRGIGPALGSFGVGDFLGDPALTVYQGNSAIAANDNWANPGGNGTAVTAADAAVGAFPLADSTSLDSALVTALPANPYSAVVTANGGTSGLALAEIYDASPAATYTTTAPRLVNLSAMTEAGGGPGALIVGFVVSGATSENVLIRGIGPALAGYGVGGFLQHPMITLSDSAGNVLATNAGWGGSAALSAAFAQVGAFPLSPNSADSALAARLPPGAYTVQIVGADGGSGTALAEIYEIP